MDIPIVTNPVADLGLLKGVGTGGKGGRRQRPFAYAIRNGTEKVSCCVVRMRQPSMYLDLVLL